MKKAKEKALKWTSQIRKEPYENQSEKNRVQQNAKTLRRRVLIEEDLAKSSKMQHLENKDKWHLYKKVYPPPPNHSELKNPHEMLNKAKSLTIAR